VGEKGRGGGSCRDSVECIGRGFNSTNLSIGEMFCVFFYLSRNVLCIFFSFDRQSRLHLS
jgi:hypothetical protein